MVSTNEEYELELSQLQFQPVEKLIVDSPADVTQKSKGIGLNRHIVGIELLAAPSTGPFHLQVKIAKNLDMHDKASLQLQQYTSELKVRVVEQRWWRAPWRILEVEFKCHKPVHRSSLVRGTTEH